MVAVANQIDWLMVPGLCWVLDAKQVKEAMQFMDQLEVAKRAPYHGRLGGMSFSGNTDMALALGTIVFPTSPRYDTMYAYKGRDMRREWVAHIQAGAGILPDSKPNQQQKVCENKVAALVSAIHLAESSFLQEYYNWCSFIYMLDAAGRIIIFRDCNIPIQII